MNRTVHCRSTLCQALRGVVFALTLAALPQMDAATLWTGLLFTYNQASPDPTQATNQDRITPDVWLTRATSKGLFNAFLETNATALSPAGTEWAFGALTNYASLEFTNWLGLLNGKSPTTLVGQQMVLYLTSDDIYISIALTFWGSGGSGGFTYQRSTQAPTGFDLSGATVSNDDFTFNYTAAAGLSYVIESSPDLLDWVSLATNVASGSTASFSDPVGSAGARFYRVSQLPNP